MITDETLALHLHSLHEPKQPLHVHIPSPVPLKIPLYDRQDVRKAPRVGRRQGLNLFCPTRAARSCEGFFEIEEGLIVEKLVI